MVYFWRSHLLHQGHVPLHVCGQNMFFKAILEAFSEFYLPQIDPLKLVENYMGAEIFVGYHDVRPRFSGDASQGAVAIYWREGIWQKERG